MNFLRSFDLMCSKRISRAQVGSGSGFSAGDENLRGPWRENSVKISTVSKLVCLNLFPSTPQTPFTPSLLVVVGSPPRRPRTPSLHTVPTLSYTLKRMEASTSAAAAAGAAPENLTSRD